MTILVVFALSLAQTADHIPTVGKLILEAFAFAEDRDAVKQADALLQRHMVGFPDEVQYELNRAHKGALQRTAPGK